MPDKKKQIRFFGSSTDLTSGWSPSYFPTGCAESDDPYFDVFKKADGLLTKAYGVGGVDFKYVDIATPDVLEYLDDVNQIVENHYELPYVAIDGEAISAGISNAKEIVEEIKHYFDTTVWLEVFIS